MPFSSKKKLFSNPDYLIIGGGVSGIMCAYRLSERFPSSKINILEQNKNTYNDYLEAGYGQLDQWFNAFQDGEYNQSFISSDSPKEIALVGKGLGGGSLHFGLQYINTPLVVNQNYKDWVPYFNKITRLLNLQRYNYNNSSMPKDQTHLKDTLDANNEMLTFNNLIYSQDITANIRYLLGSLITNNNNINITYDVKITDATISNNKITKVIDRNNNSYLAKNFIMAAGTLNTCLLLQKLGIECGNGIFDHAGISITYQPPIKDTSLPNYTKSQLDTLNNNGDIYAYFSQPVLTSTEITSLQDPENNDTSFVKQITLTDNPEINKNNINYIYTIGNFFSTSHPGGNKNSLFRKHNWNGNKVLALKHGFNQALDRVVNTAGGKLVGILNDMESPVNDMESPVNDMESPVNDMESPVNDMESPVNDMESPVNDMESPVNDIIGHLQTRDTNNTWQTYYSEIPQQPVLIVTYAQANLIPGQGFIKYQNNNLDNNYILKLNHFGDTLHDNTLEKQELNDKYALPILEAYQINNKILKQLGYKQVDPEPDKINLEYIKNNSKTIYHYHGGTSEIIDNRQRLLKLTNTSIADISILPKPFGGSTSSIALVTGYRCADMI